MSSTSLQYPIGKFTKQEFFSSESCTGYVSAIEQFPSQLSAIVEGINENQLNLTYRPEGWTVRQIIHHLSDSHMNSFMRFKLALTEANPVIKPYKEALWAELTDSKLMPIQTALNVLAGLHAKWVFLMQGFSEEDWSQTFTNPESGSIWRLDQAAGLYAWHGAHHLAHIQLAIA